MMVRRWWMCFPWIIMGSVREMVSCWHRSKERRSIARSSTSSDSAAVPNIMLRNQTPPPWLAAPP